MKYLFLLSAVLLTSCQSRSVGDAVQAAKRVYPGLLFNADEEKSIKKSIAENAVLKKAFEKLVDRADAMLEEQPVGRELEGRRLLYSARIYLKRIFVLSFVYRMTGDEKYFKKAQNEMLSASSLSDWNPRHFLDTAEMTAGLALGMDLLHDKLSKESRAAITEAIVEKGLKPGLKGSWWITSKTNWNQVCHGGLTLGALTVLESHPQIASQIIQQAVENNSKAIDEIYGLDGVYPEGPGYWNYGTVYNVYLISALESVLGTDFGLSDKPGFKKTADYYLHSGGPSGYHFNFSDGKPGIYPSAAHFWFAKRFEKPELMWNESKKFLDRVNSEESGLGSPLYFIWYPRGLKADKPSDLNWKGEGKVPIAFHRSGWDENDTFVAVKGGSANVSHGHMDAGSFVIDSQGVRWAEDLGSQAYHYLESSGINLWDMKQKSSRWDVFRLNNFSHNTLVVDGKKQNVEGSAEIISFSEGKAWPHTVLDLTVVYKDQLSQAKRGIFLQNKSVLIQDEIKSLKDSTVRWAFLTKANVKLINDSKAVLTKDGKSMFVELMSPVNAKLKVFDLSKSLSKFDEPNPGVKILGFDTQCSKDVTTTLTVWISPEESEKKPVLKSLVKWAEIE